LTARLWVTPTSERCGQSSKIGARSCAIGRALEFLVARIAQNTPLTNWQITNVLPRINDLSHDDGLFMEYINTSMQRPPESVKRLRDFVEKRATPLQAPKDKKKN
jgi:(methylthio)acryloyl-CoA hydratase